MNDKMQSSIQRVRNKLDIDTKTIMNDDIGAAECKRLIMKAGTIVQPAGNEYVGSAVVHFYKSSFSSEKFTFISVCPFIESIPETIGGLGHDELKRKLMAAYGRKVRGK